MPSEPSRWRLGAAPTGLLYHLGILARVNLFAVPPSTLLFFVLSSNHSSWNLARVFAVTLLVVNCNYAFLNSFYYLVWRRLRTRGAHAYLILCAVAPFLGAGAALTAKGLLRLFEPGPPTSVWPLMAMNALLAVLFGLAFFRVEDLRQAQRSTLARLSSSEEKQKDMEGARDRAHIASLQALIKPHFVFNTLNAIVALIPENPQKAEETTLRLARLMRYLLEVSDEDMMSLESELGVVEAYLEIEKVRLGLRLGYQIRIAPELAALPVPALILQPLVENAVQHGVRQRPAGGMVWVRVSAEAEYCRIEIVDNGPGFSSHHGVGQSMRLVRARLECIYHGKYELVLERDAAAGETIVVLRLPFMVPRDAHEPAPRAPLPLAWPAPTMEGHV
jgi:signal transduction histidine kinase